MEQVITAKSYDETVKLIYKYIEWEQASKEEKDKLASLFTRLTVEKEDPIKIHEEVHKITYNIWYRGYIDHERGYMCIIF